MSSTSTGRLNIQMEARRLRDQAVGVGSVRPTPVVAIAQSLGYAVSEFDQSDETQGVLGAISHNPKAIYVSADQISGRKRFTIAHEIGHAVLHADEIEGEGIVDYRGDLQYGYAAQGREYEANQFAAALLMPSDVFESLWIAYGQDLRSVAEHLEVSVESARYRAKNLGLV